MVDFVSEQEQRLISSVKSRNKEFSSQYLDRIFAYANFLKQPLSLKMFVVWQCKPDSLDLMSEKYLKAQDLILFKGRINDKTMSVLCNEILEDKTIGESNVCYGLELTESAIKSLGL